MILEFCKWLASTKWSIALHESLYMYPWIESAHVLSICLFIGILLLLARRNVTSAAKRILFGSSIGFFILLFIQIILKNQECLIMRI